MNLKILIAIFVISLNIQAQDHDDLNRTVKIGAQDVIAIYGYVDIDIARKELAHTNLIPKNFLGKAMAYISLSRSSDVIGCGCPDKYNDFVFGYVVESDKKGIASLSVNTAYANHDQRILSLRHKFGAVFEKANMDFLANNRGFSVDYIDIGNSTPIIRVESKLGAPKAILPINAKFNFFTIGGTFEGQHIEGTYFYQIVKGGKFAVRPWITGIDKLVLPEGSKVAAELIKIGFKPFIWQTTSMKNTLAHLPLE